ncbi:MAG: type II secretion system F family protein [Slackia sp.]|nr:type II secretion system F family protein [Slackia sp.]
MEGGVFLAASCAAGFACAFSAGCALCADMARVYAAVVAQEELSDDARSFGVGGIIESMARYYARNGVPACSAAARAMVRASRFRRLFDDAAGIMRRRGWDATGESVASLVSFATCCSFVVTLVTSRTLIAACLVPLCVVSAAVVAVSQVKAKEQDLLRDQVPDALRCMEACLHAGLSLPQAFAEVASEARDPLKELFLQVTRDIDLGFSVQDALSRFRRNAGLDELKFVAMALDVQYACGGSATPVLRSALRSLSAGVDLRRSLRVQTAQARLSAQVVSVMPVFLPAILSLVSPGFLEPFFESSYGMAMLCAALCMQVAGVVIVRRMLDVGI